MNTNPQPSGTHAKAWFCPTCGSPDIMASTLAGGDASCNTCPWKGKVEDLPTFHFTHGLGSPDEVFREFFNDMRKVFTTHFANVLAPVLMKWGFIDPPTPTTQGSVAKVLARYLNAAALSIVKGLVEERKLIEKEARSGQ